MGKIDIPLMRRHIRTFGHVTQITQITVIYDFPVIFLGNTIDFHGVGFIDQIKQGGKGMAQAYTTTATMTDVIHSLQFFIESLLVIK
jgi:hypothetical protein